MYTCICACIYIYICMDVCTYVRGYVYLHACTHICVQHAMEAATSSRTDCMTLSAEVCVCLCVCFLRLPPTCLMSVIQSVTHTNTHIQVADLKQRLSASNEVGGGGGGNGREYCKGPRGGYGAGEKRFGLVVCWV